VVGAKEGSMTKRSMSTARSMIYAIAGVAAIALTLASVGLAPSRAQEPPPPILVEELTPRSEFTDHVQGKFRVKRKGHRHTHVINMHDPSRTVVTRITVQPGAQFPWHTHPGAVIVNVAQGELVYVAASDCVERLYPAGTAFVDEGHGHVHTAFNPTNDVTVLYATFFEVPAEGPLTITEGVEAPARCQVGS
jgi:quercetin dioxygenase-like cupin family protein